MNWSGYQNLLQARARKMSPSGHGGVQVGRESRELGLEEDRAETRGCVRCAGVDASAIICSSLHKSLIFPAGGLNFL